MFHNLTVSVARFLDLRGETKTRPRMFETIIIAAGAGAPPARVSDGVQGANDFM